MSARDVVAGAIVLLLGAVGFMAIDGRIALSINLSVLSVYFTTLGAEIMFGAIAIIGFAVRIGGIASMGDEEPTRTVVERTVVINS
jgi:membrane-bound ClpP family serine protease